MCKIRPQFGFSFVARQGRVLRHVLFNLNLNKLRWAKKHGRVVWQFPGKNPNPTGVSSFAPLRTILGRNQTHHDPPIDRKGSIENCQWISNPWGQQDSGSPTDLALNWPLRDPDSPVPPQRFDGVWSGQSISSPNFSNMIHLKPQKW